MNKNNQTRISFFLILIATCSYISAASRTEERIKKQHVRQKRIEQKRSVRFSDPQHQLIAMGDAYIVSRALHTVAQLKVADHLYDSPKTAQEIATEMDLNPDALDRLLGLLALYNVFEIDQDQQYHLTELSDYLVSDNPDSLQLYLTQEDETRWNSFSNLKYTIKTGKPAFDVIYGTDYFS